ncbi:MAG TPA: HAD family hydrolase [Gemmatimonadales bacterium]|nr:HAD family hydrolase [Gemmatimonadales bacterium]
MSSIGGKRTVRDAAGSLRRLAARWGVRAHAIGRRGVDLALGDSARARAVARFFQARDIAATAARRTVGRPGTVRLTWTSADAVRRVGDLLPPLLAPAPQALLFDLDGTLVDVTGSYEEAIVRTVASFLAPRRPPSRARVLAVKRSPAANDDVDAVLMALARLGRRPPRAEVERRFDALYLGTAGRPGLVRTERWLISLGALRHLAAWVPLAIVTGRPRLHADLAFTRRCLRACFSAVVTVDDAPGKKPDPAPLRVALRHVGVRHAWMIGDAPADLLAARRAGVPAIGITEGRAAHEALLRRYRPLGLLTRADEMVDVMRVRTAVENG